MTQKEKYIWLIDTIYRAKEISLKDIAYKWRDYIGGGVDETLHRATFNRWKRAIEEQFHLYISCNRYNNKYYIENPEVIEDDKLKKWMLDTFATGSVINGSINIHNRILVNKIPSGNEHLTPIINAMKANRKVMITFRPFGSHKSSTFPIEPYCVKLFENRWYVFGLNNYREERIYCLDRIMAVAETDETFQLPENFDAEERFRPFFGVEIGSGADPKTILIRAFKNHKYYLQTLPIHETQTLIEDSGEYADFSLYVTPTFDLILKLLSFGSMVEVLKPVELRNEMKKRISEMSDIYEMFELNRRPGDLGLAGIVDANFPRLNGNFAAIDFETANERRSSVCSVGIVVVREGRIVDRFYSLIQPSPNYYTKWTSDIHGLTRKETDGQPLFPEVWDKVRGIIEGLPLVAHNKPFDEGCLKAVFSQYGMEYPDYKFHCTLAASRRCLKLPNHRLHTVARACGYDLKNHHHALADAEACAAIAMKIL